MASRLYQRRTGGNGRNSGAEGKARGHVGSLLAAGARGRDAPWHGSQAVRRWLREHQRQVKQTGQGVRRVNGYLPLKRLWLHPSAPTWGHGQRRVVEAAGLLTAAPRIGRGHRHPRHQPDDEQGDK